MQNQLPVESTIFKTEERDSDSRGSILSIVDHEIQNVSIIETNPGEFRSNHYHHVDFHFMYVLNGEIDYFFKPIDNDNKEIKYFKVREGQTIFSPSQEIHSCYFPTHTTLIVSSGFPRDQKTYEKDTVRVNFLNKNNINQMLEKYCNE